MNLDEYINNLISLSYLQNLIKNNRNIKVVKLTTILNEKSILTFQPDKEIKYPFTASFRVDLPLSEDNNEYTKEIKKYVREDFYNLYKRYPTENELKKFISENITFVIKIYPDEIYLIPIYGNPNKVKINFDEGVEHDK
ncbi:MAG: hypothetical protein ACP5RZ_06135 [Thermoplasmata archaeon]